MPGASSRPPPRMHFSPHRRIPALNGSSPISVGDDGNTHPSMIKRETEMKTGWTKTGVAFAFAGLALAGMALPAHADQLQDVLQRKELRCGTYADVPPF